MMARGARAAAAVALGLHDALGLHGALGPHGALGLHEALGLHGALDMIILRASPFETIHTL